MRRFVTIASAAVLWAYCAYYGLPIIRHPDHYLAAEIIEIERLAALAAGVTLVGVWFLASRGKLLVSAADIRGRSFFLRTAFVMTASAALLTLGAKRLTRDDRGYIEAQAIHHVATKRRLPDDQFSANAWWSRNDGEWTVHVYEGPHCKGCDNDFVELRFSEYGKLIDKR